MKAKLRRPLAVAFLAITMNAFSQNAGPKSDSTPATVSSTSENSIAEIQLGKPLHLEDPEVPKNLRDKSVVAALGATIKTDGSFADFTKLAGDDEFDDFALAAVERWQYTPATLNGSPVEARVFVLISAVKGDLHTNVELDSPFATKPKVPINDQIATGDLYTAVGKGVTPPKAIYSPDPEYSIPARIAKYQGTCLVGAVIARDGTISDVWINRKLGLGLDQKALATVRQWKFEPATKDGHPVAVMVNVEVQFRLY